MQSTGHTSTQAVSLVPTQGSQMIYAITLMMIVQASVPGERASVEPAAERCGDAAVTALFTPVRPALGAYDVCTSETPFDRAVEASRGAGLTIGAIEALEALEAFGSSGAYNRAALAQLFGGQRVRVARGWIDRGDRFESVTLLSPYPDASLTRLQPGTMRIVFAIRRKDL